MSRALAALVGLIGAGLVLAAGVVLADGAGRADGRVYGTTSGNAAQPIDKKIVGPAVRVLDALLVVNKDGSAAVGADLSNVGDAEVSLMGVMVSVEGRPLAVNATEMWLPVPVGQPAVVGAASDAGGFVVPDGITDASHAELEFRFDDGTCILAGVTAVARTREHRSIHPKSGRAIGPETTDEPPAGSKPCGPESRDRILVAG